MKSLQAIFVFILLVVVSAEDPDEMDFAVRHTSPEDYYSIVSVKHPLIGKICFGALIGEIRVLVDYTCILAILHDSGVYAEIGIKHYLSDFVRQFDGKDTRYENDYFAVALLKEKVILVNYLSFIKADIYPDGALSLGMDRNRFPTANSIPEILDIFGTHLTVRTRLGVKDSKLIEKGSFLLHRGKLLGMSAGFVKFEYGCAPSRRVKYTTYSFMGFDENDITELNSLSQ